ncbi:MAG: hypothetical protein PWR27_1151 [Petroclostridium sp.]|jgi:hypothetical protein|nr:hypothetical protein [Clostridia bacterium]MDK2810442.1 hypothetical protein [Petroclostridium sp.]
MKLSNLIRSKIICLSIIWCFFSWAIFLNYYSESDSFSIITAAPTYSLNITYKLYNPSIKTFSNIHNDSTDLEAFAFSLSMILCITCGLIIAKIIYQVIRLFLNNNKLAKKI